MDGTAKRNRRSPNRFGEKAVTDELNFSSSTDDMYKDNSMDDITFIPPPKEKVVATVSKKSFKQNKKRKIDVHHGESSKVQSAVYETALVHENFDDAFDLIEATMKNQQHQNKQTKIHHDENSKKSPESRTKEINSYSCETDADEPENAHVPKSINDIHSICAMLLNRFETYSRETLARISLLEDAMLSGGSTQAGYQSSNLVQKIEHANVFSKANNLPIKDSDNLHKFETNLKDEKFKDIAIDCLANLPEVSCAIGNQPKMLKKVLTQIMDRNLIAKFSWTGKSSSEERKLSFRSFVNIKDLLYKTVKKLDINYTSNIAENHLKNKILRYANDFKRDRKPVNKSKVDQTAEILSTVDHDPEKFQTAMASRTLNTNSNDNDLSLVRTTTSRLEAHAQMNPIASNNRYRSSYEYPIDDIQLPRGIPNKGASNSIFGLQYNDSEENLSHGYQSYNHPAKKQIPNLMPQSTYGTHLSYDHSSKNRMRGAQLVQLALQNRGNADFYSNK